MSDQDEIFYGATNLTVLNRFVKNPNRYYHEEYFDNLPTLETKPVVTQATSIRTPVPDRGAQGGTGFYSKAGIIRTASTVLTSNIAREFTFNNNYITKDSLILTNVQGVSSNINDATTVFGNSSLSVFTHSRNDGNCKVRLTSIGNERKNIDLPSQTYDIGFVIDPHITANEKWSISGTNATDSNVLHAEGSLGTGIILSTRGTEDDQCILHPRGYNTTISKAGLLINTTLVSKAGGATLSITGSSDSNFNTDARSFFSPGDPVYLSDGSLIGILKSVLVGTLTFTENVFVEVAASAQLYLRPPKSNLGLSKFLSLDSEIEFECSIRTMGSISDTAFWCGLKQTSTGNYTTDNNQAYFFYDSSGNTLGQTITDPTAKTFLYFVYSINGTDYSNKFFALAINTIYNLRITISTRNSTKRVLSVYIDSVSSSSILSKDGKTYTEYVLGTTAATPANASTASVVSSSNKNTSTTQLNTGTYLFPFVGLQTTNTDPSTIVVNHIKVSRLSSEQSA